MNRIETAKKVIEKVQGFTDKTTAVGEAWQIILSVLEEKDREIKRLDDRDGNATIQLIFPEKDGNPFNKIDLKHVDFGVADNIYVMESQEVIELQSRAVQAEARAIENCEGEDKPIYNEAMDVVEKLKARCTEKDNIIKQAAKECGLLKTKLDEAEARVDNLLFANECLVKNIGEMESRLAAAEKKAADDDAIISYLRRVLENDKGSENE